MIGRRRKVLTANKRRTTTSVILDLMEFTSHDRRFSELRPVKQLRVAFIEWKYFPSIDLRLNFPSSVLNPRVNQNNW